LAQTEYLVADRLSWMRFCRLGPSDAVPDANTLWDFREALIAAGALERLFTRLAADAGDGALRHDQGGGRGREDQLVLRLARAAADTAGTGHRGGNPGWAAARGYDAAGADGAVSSGEVGAPALRFKEEPTPTGG
jgi:IS5 family transposase